MKGQATATIETIVIVTLHSDDKKLNGKRFEHRNTRQVKVRFEHRNTRQVQVTRLSITDEIIDLDYVKLGNQHPGAVMGLKEIKKEPKENAPTTL